MKLILTTMMLLTSVAFGVTRVGATPQDESIRLLLDNYQCDQNGYIAAGYGTYGEKMLEEAFEARAEQFHENANVVKIVARNDIRNIPCVDPTSSETNQSYIVFAKRCQNILFVPDEEVQSYGFMDNTKTTNAFDFLMVYLSHKTGKKIKFKDPSGNLGKYRQCDANLISYSFWPMGVAIHNRDAFAEVVSHFFNFTNPRTVHPYYSGTWTSSDYKKVSVWNEFVSALRGVKVHAFSLGYNLNTANITNVIEVDEDFITNTVVQTTTPQFDLYYDDIKDNLDNWGKIVTNIEVIVDNDMNTVTNKIFTSLSPVSLNSYILLKAYAEAVSVEGTADDNAAYLRFREMCRNYKIARMVL